MKKAEFIKTINSFGRDYQLIGPVRDEDIVIFQHLVGINQISWDYLMPLKPLKEFFLGHGEVLFGYSRENGKIRLEEDGKPRKRIIVGARPCDAKGLTLLDKVFMGQDYKDPHYIEKRENTTIIGFACLSPDKACYCTSMDCGPFETEDLDMLLLEQGDDVLVNAITDKGKAIIDVQDKFYEMKEGIEKKITKSCSVPEGLNKIFEDPYWRKVSDPCISCGICTFSCPTCHCFDLFEEERKQLRCWDGCAFPQYTLMASGENPRQRKYKRYRQRVYHRFSYFKENFGSYLCVGCGRCIRKCPVKIDIAEIVNNAKHI